MGPDANPQIPGDNDACWVVGEVHPEDMYAEHGKVIHFGVPRQPDDFVKEAVKAGLPRDMVAFHKQGHAQNVAEAVFVFLDDRKIKADKTLCRWRQQPGHLAGANPELTQSKLSYLKP